MTEYAEIGSFDGSVVGLITLGPVAPSSLVISLGESKGPMVTIRANGIIEYGPNYTPDEAAKAFWDAIGLERKQRV